MVHDRPQTPMEEPLSIFSLKPCQLVCSDFYMIPCFSYGINTKMRCKMQNETVRVLLVTWIEGEDNFLYSSNTTVQFIQNDNKPAGVDTNKDSTIRYSGYNGKTLNKNDLERGQTTIGNHDNQQESLRDGLGDDKSISTLIEQVVTGGYNNKSLESCSRASK